MPTPTSNCPNPSCRTKVEGDVKLCPNCGRRMRTPRGIRTAGWVLLACGGFLVGFMAYLGSVLAPSMLHPGVRTVDGTTFSGTRQQASGVFALLGSIAAFGLASIGYGIWMIVTSRRSITLMILVLVFAAGILGTVWWLLAVLPH